LARLRHCLMLLSSVRRNCSQDSQKVDRAWVAEQRVAKGRGEPSCSAASPSSPQESHHASSKRLLALLLQQGQAPHIVPTFHGVHLATTFHAARQLEILPFHPFVVSLCERISSTNVSSSHIWKGVSSSDLVEMFVDLVHLCVGRDLSHAVCASLADVIGSQKILHKLQCKDLAKIYQAAHQLGYCNPWLLVRLAARLMEPAVLNLLRTSEVALIVSSLAGLGFKDAVLFQELESKILCLETILLMTSEEAKAIVQAYASFNLLSEKLRSALQSNLASRMGSMPIQD